MARIFYSDHGITIWHADNRDVFPFIDDESVDLILSDPPYGIDYHSNSKIKVKGEKATDIMTRRIEGDKNLGIFKSTLYQANRIHKPGGHVYFFCKPLLIGDVVQAVSSGWQVKSIIVWDKGDSPGLGDLDYYGNNWEAIVFAIKGKGRPLLTGRQPNIIRYNWNAQRDPVHPTVKPVPLLQWLVRNSTRQGDTVIDYFGGSCTTAMACKIEGRLCITIEMDERFCEAGAVRLQQEVLEVDSLSIDSNDSLLPTTDLVDNIGVEEVSSPATDSSEVISDLGSGQVNSPASEKSATNVTSIFRKAIGVDGGNKVSKPSGKKSRPVPDGQQSLF